MTWKRKTLIKAVFAADEKKRKINSKEEKLTRKNNYETKIASEEIKLRRLHWKKSMRTAKKMSISSSIKVI